MDLQAKYEELIRIREEEAAAKEELTQELRALELEAVKAHASQGTRRTSRGYGSSHSLCKIFTGRRRHYIKGVGQ